MWFCLFMWCSQISCCYAQHWDQGREEEFSWHPAHLPVSFSHLCGVQLCTVQGWAHSLISGHSSSLHVGIREVCPLSNLKECFPPSLKIFGRRRERSWLFLGAILIYILGRTDGSEVKWPEHCPFSWAGNTWRWLRIPDSFISILKKKGMVRLRKTHSLLLY